MKSRLLKSFTRVASAIVSKLTAGQLRFAILHATEAVYDRQTEAVYNPTAHGLYDLQREGTYTKKDSYALPKGRYILTKRDDMTYDVFKDFENAIATYDRIWSSQDFLDNSYLDKSRREFFSDVADRIVSRARTAQPPVPIIEVGVGPGEFLVLLARRLSDAGIEHRLSGSDYSAVSIERCRQLLPKGQFEVGSIHALQYSDESFDIVVCMEVLEHIQHVQKAVAELWRIVRPSGDLIITVPNGEWDNWIGHINFWSEDQFRQLLMEGNRPIPEVSELIDEGRTMYFRVTKPGGGSPAIHKAEAEI